MIAPAQVEAAFRLYLVKAGFGWALEWPWGEAKIEPLGDKVKAGSAEIMAFREYHKRNAA